jgi:hypothetical protein
MDIVGLILEVSIEGNKRKNNGQGISDSPSVEGLSILVIGKWITML